MAGNAPGLRASAHLQPTRRRTSARADPPPRRHGTRHKPRDHRKHRPREAVAWGVPPRPRETHCLVGRAARLGARRRIGDGYGASGANTVGGRSRGRDGRGAALHCLHRSRRGATHCVQLRGGRGLLHGCGGGDCHLRKRGRGGDCGGAEGQSSGRRDGDGAGRGARAEEGVFVNQSGDPVLLLCAVSGDAQRRARSARLWSCAPSVWAGTLLPPDPV